MGESYNVVSLAGKLYLEYQGKDTEWRLVALKLDLDQEKKIDKFESDQAVAKTNFLKSLLD